MTLLVCFFLLNAPTISGASGEYSAIEASFNKLCSQSEKAASLSIEQLTQMIDECDSLSQKLQKSSHPKKKVLLFRVKKCRNFLDFIVQTKNTKEAPPGN